MVKVKFGKAIHPIQQITPNKTKQLIDVYRGGQKTVKTRYEERIRVNNEQEELSQYIKHKKDHMGQNIEFKVEGKKDPNKDYYHVIKIWEE